MANSESATASERTTASHFRLRRVRRAVPRPIRNAVGSRYGWVAPTFLLLFSLTIFPLLFLVYLSFQEWSLLIAARRGFVGLENYRSVIEDGAFLNSLIVTATFTGIAVPTQLILGTGIALFINRRMPERWRSLLQTMFLLPMMMSYIAVGLIWRFFWNGSIGFVNYLLESVGLPTQGWLGDPTMALVTILVADVWQWTPFVVLVVLAGLEGLPEEPFEAAKMDGAKGWQTFRHITLPLLKPIFLVVVLFRTADAFRVFDKVFIMTSGGPGDSSMTLSVLIYFKSFKDGAFGEAAVMSIFMLAIISVVALTIISRARKTGAI